MYVHVHHEISSILKCTCLQRNWSHFKIYVNVVHNEVSSILKCTCLQRSWPHFKMYVHVVHNEVSSILRYRYMSIHWKERNAIALFGQSNCERDNAKFFALDLLFHLYVF